MTAKIPVSQSESEIPWSHRLAVNFYRNHERTARLRLVRWLRRALALRTVRMSLRPGVVMELDDRDYVQREILHNGGYEMATLRRFEQLLTDTTHFVDIGAHVGQYSLFAARALAARGRVFAFEPIAENASQLLRNAQLSRLENLEIFGCAIGAIIGSCVWRRRVQVPLATIASSIPAPVVFYRPSSRWCPSRRSRLTFRRPGQNC
jgi:hypothetical protein